MKLPQLTPKRKIILLALALIGGIVVLSLVFKGSPDTTTTDGASEIYDPNSGDTISDPDDKTPDVYGTVSDAPVFLGLSKLLDAGLTLDQVNGFQYAFYHYGKNTKTALREVSVSVSTINVLPHDRYSTSLSDTMLFDVLVNKKNLYKVKLDFTGFTAIQIYLSNEAGEQFYDSGIVDDKKL